MVPSAIRSPPGGTGMRQQKRQAQRDAAAGGGDRRRAGAFYTSFAVAMLAWNLPLPWWGMVGIVGLTYIGLHMVAGVSLKWSWV